MNDYGQRLKAARQAAGWTLRALADHCGVNFTYISHIEHGRALPSPETARLFGAALDADLRLPRDLEAARLRSIVRAARGFLDTWDAGDGGDADTCDAADALRAALRDV